MTFDSRRGLRVGQLLLPRCAVTIGRLAIAAADRERRLERYHSSRFSTFIDVYRLCTFMLGDDCRTTVLCGCNWEVPGVRDGVAAVSARAC